MFSVTNVDVTIVSLCYLKCVFMSGVCWSNWGTIKERILQPLFCSAACSAPFLVFSNAFSACRTKLSGFFTSGGKRKHEGVCPQNSPYSWATAVRPQGKHQPAIVRMYKLSKSSNIVKVKTNHWSNYKKKNDDTEGPSLTSKAKFKLMCTSSLL